MCEDRPIATSSWTIFLGPSLRIDRARQIVGATYLPPIARGDLDRLLHAGHRRFAIIDGVFDQSLSVSLSEIRAALEAGAVVVGAGSMGALRAAEAASLGMHGVGWVFEEYRSRRIESDAEVCLTFRADTWQPLTVPLVNVRWALRELQSSGHVAPDAAERLLDVASRIDFRDRHARRIFTAAMQHASELASAAQTLIERLTSGEERHDRKALDAVQMLECVRDGRVPQPRAVSSRDESRHWADTAPPLAAFFAEAGRVSDPQQMLVRARRDARAAGVTRLADLSELDTCGVQVWSATRPLAEDGDLTVNGGKGIHREQAQIGALMESVERWCATTRGRDVVRLPTDAVHDALDPRRLILPAGMRWDPTRPLGWMRARDLVDGCEMHVPAVAACLTCPEDRWVFMGGSTGLAAGASLCEATLAGVLEVIERDALAFHEWTHAGAPIDLATVTDPDSRRILDENIDRGLDIRAFALPSPIAITTIQVVVDDPERSSALYINGGTATHLLPEVAFQKALLEALFSRLTIISGARENLDRIAAESDSQGAPRIRAALRARGAPRVSLDDCVSWSLCNPSDALAALVGVVAAAGFRRVLVCRLTSTRMVNEAVRVVIPGMEPGGAAGRVGPRLFRRLKNLAGVSHAPHPSNAIRQHETGSSHE